MMSHADETSASRLSTTSLGLTSHLPRGHYPGNQSGWRHEYYDWEFRHPQSVAYIGQVS